MKNILFVLVCLVMLTNTGCKKEPTTGSIKILFSGTPQAGHGETVTLEFAQDLYHLQQEIFTFSKTSNAPHAEIIMGDIKPQVWYYRVWISSPGIPNEREGNVEVIAGETGTVTVQF